MNHQQDFHEALFAISRAQTPEFKPVILFRIYDVDEDGLVNKEDMIAVLSDVIGEEVPRDVLEAIVTQTIHAHDWNDDMALNVDEFKRLLDSGDMDVLFGYVP
eukprot:1195865-Prorocentrum_minimum.AAC.5